MDNNPVVVKCLHNLMVVPEEMSGDHQRQWDSSSDCLSLIFMIIYQIISEIFKGESFREISVWTKAAGWHTDSLRTRLKLGFQVYTVFHLCLEPLARRGAVNWVHAELCINSWYCRLMNFGPSCSRGLQFNCLAPYDRCSSSGVRVVILQWVMADECYASALTYYPDIKM